MVDQVGSLLCHASGRARWAKAAPHAVEGQELVAAAVAAAQSQEAMGQDGAFEEGLEPSAFSARRSGRDLQQAEIALLLGTMIINIFNLT